MSVNQHAPNLRRPYRQWSTPEIRILREVYPDGGAAGVQARLPHRTKPSIRSMARRLGIRRPLHWTAAEIRILREGYPDGGSVGVQARLPHRTRRSIYVMASKLGICQPRHWAAGSQGIHRSQVSAHVAALIEQHGTQTRQLAFFGARPGGIGHVG